MSASLAALDQVASWVCTFALHSTVALGGALVLSWLLGRRARAWQEPLLRHALWVALISASLQVAVFGGPVALTLPALPALEPAAPAEGYGVALAAVSEVAEVPTPAALQLPPWSWSSVVVGLTVAAAVLGGLWFLRAQWRLRQVLASRRPETDPTVLTTMAEAARDLGLAQTPRLSRCPGLGTPIAFGWLRPEICLPERTAELSPTSLRAMLAHEVAHVRAADPAWMQAIAALQALFPWQVLFLAVRRRWSHLVELRCDAVAAHHTSPTAVARCLLDVADWLRPPVPAVALGMAARPSALRERVEAALHSAAVPTLRRRWSTAFGGASLSSLTLLLPSVHTAAVDPTEVLALLDSEAVVDPANTPTPAAAAAREGLFLVEVERASLQQEFAALQAEVARLRSPSPQLLQKVSTLSRRLHEMSALHDRLAATVGAAEAK